MYVSGRDIPLDQEICETPLYVLDWLDRCANTANTPVAPLDVEFYVSPILPECPNPPRKAFHVDRQEGSYVISSQQRRDLGT